MSRIRYEDRYLVELPRPLRVGRWLQVRGADDFAVAEGRDATLFRSEREAERWAALARARGESPTVCLRAVGVES